MQDSQRQSGSFSQRALTLASIFVLLASSFYFTLGTRVKDVAAVVATAPETATWGVTDGGYVKKVLAAPDGSTYLAGDFSYVGPVNKSYLASIDASTAQISATPSLPAVSGGDVEEIISDGAGGYILGGSFNQVGGQAREGVAHINSTGVLQSLSLDFDNIAIKTLALSGSTLYIGGTFTTVNASPRVDLVAVNLTTSAVSSFVADTDNSGVEDILIDGSDIYVGGYFATINGSSRQAIAKLDTAGTVQAWDPGSGGTLNHVGKILKDGSNIYISGFFTNVGGAARNCLARLDATTGLADAGFDATIPAGSCFAVLFSTKRVDDIELVGTTLYVAGNFTNIGGAARNRLASIDTTGGGTATAWDPNITGGVDLGLMEDIEISGTNVYVSGDFSLVDGVSRRGLAAIDTTTGDATAWEPIGSASNVAYLPGYKKIIPVGGNVILGGSFTSVGGVMRNDLARLTSGGIADSWNPGSNGLVNDLLLDGSNLFVAGQFTIVGGQARSSLAQLSATTGSATSWDAGTITGVGAYVDALEKDASKLYLGGSFTAVNGTGRASIASVNLSDAALSTWNPGVTGSVACITLAGTNIYIGGNFTAAGGAARNHIAEISTLTDTSNATSWDPNSNGTVEKIIIKDSNTVYVTGNFQTIGGQTRKSVAGISRTTGLADSLSLTMVFLNPSVNDLVQIGSVIYIAGDNFTDVNGSPRQKLAALDATGTVLSWNPGASGTYYDLEPRNYTLYMGGTSLSFSGSYVNSSMAYFGHGLPSITTINPDFRTTGEGAASITVNGLSFVPTSVVRWNGSDRVTSFINDEQVTFTVLTGDQTSAGTVPITVFNPTPAGGLSALMNISVLSPNNLVYASPSTIGAGENASGDTTEVADMNNDGWLDIVRGRGTPFIGGNRVEIFLNDQDGTFTLHDFAVLTGGYVTSLAIADFDGVNGPDIVASDDTSSDVEVWLNDGSGGIGAGTTYLMASSTRPVDLAVADIDGDTDMDIASVNGVDNQIAKIKNNGDGTFAAVTYNAAAGNPIQLVLKQFIGSASPDVFTLAQTDRVANIYTNSGTGSFSFTTSFDTGMLAGETPSRMHGGNVGGDALNDIVTVSTDGHFSTLINASGLANQYYTGTGRHTFDLADIDADTDLDIITVQSGEPDGASILLNDGAGNYTSRTNYYFDPGSASPMNYSSVRVADFDNDTKADILVSGTDTGPRVLFRTTTSTAVPASVPGNLAVAITVNGTHFSPSSKVLLNGVVKSTTYLSSTQLQANLTAGDIPTAGAYTLSVQNPDTGLSTTGSIALTVTTPVASSGSGGGAATPPVPTGPAVSDISPKTKPVGASENVTIVIKGQRFTDGAKVWFGTTVLETTFVSATELTAVIPASLLNEQGIYDVTVMTGDGVGISEVSEPIGFFVGPRETLTLKIEPVTAGDVEASSFADVSITTPARADGISFDQVNWGESDTGAVTIQGFANSTTGYTVMVRQDTDLRSENGDVIRGYDANTGSPVPNSNPVPWVDPTGPGYFGYSTSSLSVGGGLLDRFFSGGIRRWAALTATDQPIATHAGTPDGTVVTFKDFLLLRLGLGRGQKSGTYKNNLIITIVPNIPS